MNVDSARTVEIQPLESAREKSGAKGTGFPALMEAVLGRPAEHAKASRPQSGEPAEGASRTRVQRPESGVVRKKSARDGDPEIVPEETASASPAPRAEAETESEAHGEDKKDASPAAGCETAEAVPPTDAPAWQIAAVLAVPELVAMASGIAVDPDGQTGEESSTDAISEPAPASAPEGEVVASAPVANQQIEIADAAVRPAPIVDVGARQAAVAVVEGAISKKGADENEPESTVAAEPPTRETVEQVVRTVAEVAEVRAESRELRPPVATRESRPKEVDAPTLRANQEVLPTHATAAADVGSDASSRDGQPPAQARTNAPNAPVERTIGDAAAVGGTSTQAPTITVPEPSVRAGESAAQAGVDPTTISAPTAAAEVGTSAPAQRAQSGPAADAIALQADWLATRGGGSARLVLHPPELGEIVIRVSIRQQAVDVVMVAQTALAHSMAQDQSDRLAQAFAHRDLRLDQFEVRRADPSDSSATGQFGSSDAGARERDRAEDQGGVPGEVAGRGGRRRLAVTEGGAVTPPRFVSPERASGIDLRI